MQQDKADEKLPALRRRASLLPLLFAGMSLAAAAAYVQWRAHEAERDNPATGQFIAVDGVRLHYLDSGGTGPPVVLLHGNGSMAREMEISGLVGALSSDYRVIAFDRPGFGHSERPRMGSWTPAAQAELIRGGLERLGIGAAVVLGHSWGTLVALELALDHHRLVKGLVLVGGFYFPERRLDVTLLSPLALPLLGDAMRHTISPLVARAVAPRAVRKIFRPQPVNPRFAEEFPMELALRPLTLRAMAEDNAAMIPAAARLQGRYAEIGQPTVIIAGTGDEIVDVDRHSVRLHELIAGSELRLQRNQGHMVHYHAGLVIRRAVDRLMSLAGREAA